MLSFALAKASKGLLHLVHYDLFDYLMNQKKTFSDLEFAAYNGYIFVHTIILLVTM